ncbi:alpha/beta fold hydrolase [Cerasicoccus frondis]|uniref:alpha/beta fold hydrolase n=1 Tax=Cerasicoccus frondis TaxID=490090 RepID=UPI0028526759|nr:alpha/beta fold hydrolase [Cerasicoccus frondis]
MLHIEVARTQPVYQLGLVTPQKLAYRYFGGEGNPPIVLLHGLLGSSRNWVSAGKELTGQYEVFALDLRNHGDSPHCDSMDFGELAADVLRFLDDHDLPQAHLLGHSLGGKVAMRLAMDAPARLSSLVVVDIAPRAYPPYHLRDFDAMNALPLAELTNRKDADDRLAEAVPDWGQRQFLLTNLVRKEDRFAWSINLRALTAARDVMRANSVGGEDSFAGATTFILGGQSRFVLPEDWRIINRYFPKARIEVIDESGHNPHIEKRDRFLAAIERHRSADWGSMV